jgi:DNA-binding MarR family transcriptional regulator
MGEAHVLESLVDEVLRLSGRLVAATAQLSPIGLTGAQLLVLTSVVRAERAPTVPQIARSLGHSRQAVQRVADALVDRGLLDAVENPDHKRARLLVATPQGQAAYRESDRRSRSWAKRISGEVEPDRIQEAVSTLRVLRRRIETDRATRPDSSRTAPRTASATREA